MHSVLTDPDSYPHQFKLLVGLTTALTFDSAAVEEYIRLLTDEEKLCIRTTLLEVLKYLPLNESSFQSKK